MEVISNNVVCLMSPTSSKKVLKEELTIFTSIWDKVFKNGPSRICGTQP